MDELVGYVLVAGLIIAAIVAAVMILFYAGLIVIGGIAIIGAISGCVVAAKNFFEVLTEAHSKVPGAPGGSKIAEQAFVAFFVLALALIAVWVVLLLRVGSSEIALTWPAPLEPTREVSVAAIAFRRATSPTAAWAGRLEIRD